MTRLLCAALGHDLISARIADLPIEPIVIDGDAHVDDVELAWATVDLYRDRELMRRFFGALLGWAGVALPIEVTGSPIEARHLESGSNTLLFLFNHSRDAAHSEVLVRRAAATASDLVTGARVALVSGSAGARIAVDLHPGAVRVLELTSR